LDRKGEKQKSVSILVPNLNGLKHLQRCIPSIINQTYPRKEIIIVDNGSIDGSVEYLENIPKLKIIKNKENLGFAKAINQATQIASGFYLLVLNNDAVLDLGCVTNLVREYENVTDGNSSNLAGLAPKILFYEFPTIIDAVGTGLNIDGTGFNLGAGQVDLGQFDSPARIFGLCFAAAFLRRDLFKKVGPLEESYFAYYEDMDWCFRANAQGYEFRTAPFAVVYHGHSATAKRIMDYNVKRYLLERNRLRTMLRNFHGKSIFNIIHPLISYLSEMYRTARHPLARPISKTISEFIFYIKILSQLFRTPILLNQNLKLNKNRTLSDDQIFGISEYWRPWLISGTFYDSMHSPILNLETLTKQYELAIKRLSTKELIKNRNVLKKLLRIIKRVNWHVGGIEELVANSGSRVHFNDFLAHMIGNMYFISKQNQSLAIDPFILDLLFSLHGRKKRESITYLKNKLRSIDTSISKRKELAFQQICEQCISIFTPYFEAWNLISLKDKQR